MNFLAHCFSAMLGRMAQRSNDSKYQIVLYRMLSANPATVGLESCMFQAAGRICCLSDDLLISGTLCTALLQYRLSSDPSTIGYGLSDDGD
jgi:hypothetical protein